MDKVYIMHKGNHFKLFLTYDSGKILQHDLIIFFYFWMYFCNLVFECACTIMHMWICATK